MNEKLSGQRIEGRERGAGEQKPKPQPSPSTARALGSLALGKSQQDKGKK
jgi:hypothetical protein